MNYKSENRFIALLILALCFTHSSAFSQRLEPNNQLLWQISGKGLKRPSYLYGSYHSNDNRIFKFSDSTYAALLHADAVVLEADIYSLFNEYDPRIGNNGLQFDSRGNPYTSDKKASLTKYGSEDGRPQFLDAYFQQIAYNSNKRFFPLESVQEQLDAFENITYNNFKDYSLNTLSLSQENILQTYLKGDIENMRDMLKSQLAVSANAYNLLITNRNIIMANGIDSLCRKQSLFVAVGAAHLAGPEGIIQLLKNKGFTVKHVSATFTETPTPAEVSLRKFNSYKYEDTLRNFSVVFGGKPKTEKSSNAFKLVYQEMGQGNTFWVEVRNNEESIELRSRVKDLFTTDKAPSEIKLAGDIPAFEGITYIYGVGNCWMRVFVYKNQLFKLTCYGGNKFMNSDRYKKFFDKVELH